MKTVLMLADQVCEAFMRIKTKKYYCLPLLNYNLIVCKPENYSPMCHCLTFGSAKKDP